MPKALVIQDANGNGESLRAWLGAGAEITLIGSWPEAVDTLGYSVLAGSAVSIVIGPLGRPALEALVAIRAQGIDPAVALYTEARVSDQDKVLMAQHGLVGVLHKPFTAEQRAELVARLASYTGSGSTAAAAPIPEPPASARARMPEPSRARGPGNEAALPDLPGGFDDRKSSVSSQPSTRPAGPRPLAELPSGVQRLIKEAMPEQPAAAGAPAEAALPERLAEPRSIAIVAVDDTNSTAAVIVDHIGGAGQRVAKTPSYTDAIHVLEQFASGTQGCELLVGPLNAEGVSLVRTCRQRGYPTHVVFYTESQSQSQDQRLPAQYGCLAILRRVGLAESLRKVVAELRAHPRRAPEPPQERPRGGTTLMAAMRTPRPESLGAAGVGAAPVPLAAMRTPRPESLGTASSGRLASAAPAAPAAGPAAPGAGPVPPSARLPGASGRLRRSVQIPPAPAAAQAQAPLEIPGAAPQPGGAPRVQCCVACGREFVVVASKGLPVRCPHCQAGNTVQ